MYSIVHAVTKSQTQLSNFHFSRSLLLVTLKKIIIAIRVYLRPSNTQFQGISIASPISTAAERGIKKQMWFS